MGIKRLLTYFRQNFEDTHLSKFKNKTFGIDGMGWLYQVFYSVNETKDFINIPIIRKLERKFKVLR